MFPHPTPLLGPRSPVVLISTIVPLPRPACTKNPQAVEVPPLRQERPCAAGPTPLIERSGTRSRLGDGERVRQLGGAGQVRLAVLPCQGAGAWSACREAEKAHRRSALRDEPGRCV